MSSKKKRFVYLGVSLKHIEEVKKEILSIPGSSIVLETRSPYGIHDIVVEVSECSLENIASVCTPDKVVELDDTLNSIIKD